MKKNKRILAILLAISFLAGITTSCAVFEETSHAQTLKPYKHTKPLPKKWALENGEKPILK